MRRLALVAAIVLAVSACGDNQSEPIDLPEAPQWETLRDGERSFRCVTLWQKHGYAGGLAMWCYESEGE